MTSPAVSVCCLLALACTAGDASVERADTPAEETSAELTDDVELRFDGWTYQGASIRMRNRSASGFQVDGHYTLEYRSDGTWEGTRRVPFGYNESGCLTAVGPRPLFPGEYIDFSVGGRTQSRPFRVRVGLSSSEGARFARSLVIHP